MSKERIVLGIDWSRRGRARVYALTALGTLVCIVVAFAFDGYSFATGEWRWGTDPLNNLLIPLLLAPPFFFYTLNKVRQLAIAHHELMTVASTDGLTNLFNRRAFTEMVDGYLMRVERARPKGGMLVVDVDHFKTVNDRFGHETGDEALKLVAELIRTSVRDTDLVGRLGGEEFGVFIPGQPPESVHGIAERIRAAVNQTDFNARGERHNLSVSVGGVTFDNCRSFSDLFRGADALLYDAKHNGRNRVEMAALAPGVGAPATMH